MFDHQFDKSIKSARVDQICLRLVVKINKINYNFVNAKLAIFTKMSEL